MSDWGPPAGLVGIPQLLRLVATPTLLASEALEPRIVLIWVPGDQFTLMYSRRQGCIGASNRQQGLKPDSCR